MATLAWWSLTIVTLVIVDDLTFGPVFWLLARLGGTAVAVVTAFLIYSIAQVLLVRQGTSEQPHRLASWFLSRLQLERKRPEIASREKRLYAKVAGYGSAVLAAPVVGGVLPPLLLHKAGFGRNDVRRLSVVTSAIYAAEFAFLHGWIPGSI